MSKSKIITRGYFVHRGATVLIKPQNGKWMPVTTWYTTENGELNDIEGAIREQEVLREITARQFGIEKKDIGYFCLDIINEVPVITNSGLRITDSKTFRQTDGVVVTVHTYYGYLETAPKRIPDRREKFNDGTIMPAESTIQMNSVLLEDSVMRESKRAIELYQQLIRTYSK